MFKKYLVLSLTVLVVNLSLGSTAFAETSKEVKHAEKVKVNITKLGTGRDSRVEVKLRDKTKLKGYVSEINANNFVVVDDKTGASNEVAYSNAKQVKGNNLSNGVKIALGVGLVAAFIIIIIIAGNSD
ncbi:MAG: hypothetical protein WKF92_15790 [Pyrinomonadaceae bacterium]